MAKQHAPDWLFDNIKGLSEACQKQYLLFISILAYFILTIASSSDTDLILNDQLSLPILNINVSVNIFCSLAPLILMAFYIYLNFHLILLFQQVENLRNNFENDASRLPPVLFVGINNSNKEIQVSESFVFIVSYYLVFPISMILSSGWFIKKHSPILSYIVTLYPTLCIAVVFFFLLKLNKLSVFKINKVVVAVISVIVFSFEVLSICFLIPKANSGELYSENRHFVLQTELMKLTSVDLSQEILIKEKKKEYETYWGNLANSHLEGADLSYSILKNAYLKNAHLNGTTLYHTTFRGAFLSGADVQFAKIDGADFSYATMKNLKNVDSIMFCKARTFYAAVLDDKLKNYILKHKPELFSDKSQNW